MLYVFLFFYRKTARRLALSPKDSPSSRMLSSSKSKFFLFMFIALRNFLH